MADIVYPTYYSLHTKTSFFEVTQYFAAQKIKIIMGTYDKKTQIEVFFTIQEARKMARDINKGTTVMIPARKVVAFKPSKRFNTAQD